MPAESLAIVVCSRDRPDRLASTLSALASQAADEVLVVDSASTTDGTRAAAAAAGVRCVRVDRPGLARARNAGISATTAGVVAFTDDDCRPAPGWAEAVRAAVRPDVGVVLGRVTAEGEGAPLSVVDDAEPRTFRLGDDVMQMGHGANFTVMRGAWEQLRGFDELLGAGAPLHAGEDTDFLWRSLAAGFDVVYTPAAAVAHDQWRGRLTGLRMSYRYGVGQGAVTVKVRRLADRQALRTFSAGTVGKALARTRDDLRNRYEYGVAVGLARTIGTAAGEVRAARMRLQDGHLQPRRAHR
jgi:glycosyltransferase involved in cell wall biosynthesis